MKNKACRYAAAMCLMQIGELSKQGERCGENSDERDFMECDSWDAKCSGS